MDENPRLQILDVREPFEAQISRIDGATLIPLGELPKRYTELDPSRDLVVHCKVGGRSAKAVSFLKEHGFPRRSTSRAGSWPGATRWIRPSRSTDVGAGPQAGRRPPQVVPAAIPTRLGASAGRWPGSVLAIRLASRRTRAAG